MGKPRMIILIRHAQSEGNKNREIHQLIPDHRVKLTEDGWTQAEDAGRRLRALLKPDDTLQFYTSPYRRTRETTEGILHTLTSPDESSGAPSPFNRNQIKVYEEPRIREQDFGNFQPCSAEMERMWQERADYGHFFYRIPNGESAADAYDRISGFNESLWRSFSEADFPSVCVLVTHGLMTRVFLMKWYHWSVEYFEDLRNINHCEFIIMNKDIDNGKFILQSQLRTWSELKRQRAEEAAKNNSSTSSSAGALPLRRNTLSQFLPIKTTKKKTNASPPPRKWGGCETGCNHHHEQYPRRNKSAQDATVKGTSEVTGSPAKHEFQAPLAIDGAEASTAIVEEAVDFQDQQYSLGQPRFRHPFQNDDPGRDGGGTDSGLPTPAEGLSEESDYFDPNGMQNRKQSSASIVAKAGSQRLPRRKTTQEDLDRWANESGMGQGKRADALGDEPDELDDLATHEDNLGVHDKHEQSEGELQREEAKDKSLRGSVY